MEYRLIIPHTMVNLNEYIAKERTSKYQANSEKKQIETEIGWLCRQQLPSVAIENPVYIRYLWVERDRKRDKDNIAFAKKFIQDGLVKSGVLKNDGWRNIIGFSDEFAVDKRKPRIEVTIIETEAEANGVVRSKAGDAKRGSR